MNEGGMKGRMWREVEVLMGKSGEGGGSCHGRGEEEEEGGMEEGGG